MWMSYLKEQGVKSEGRMLLRENAPRDTVMEILGWSFSHSTYTQSRMIFVPEENSGH